MASSCRLLEWFDRAASPQQERIGHELERREIDVGLAGYGELDEAPVEPGIFGFGGIDELPAPAISLAPPEDNVTGPPSVSR